jgi:hypothetical protein
MRNFRPARTGEFQTGVDSGKIAGEIGGLNHAWSDWTSQKRTVKRVSVRGLAVAGSLEKLGRVTPTPGVIAHLDNGL